MTTAILIVDDEQSFLNSIVRSLRIQGYTDLTPIKNPLEVSELLAEKKFDVAFLDITMPEMNGLELLEIIKGQNPQTECIMVTAIEDIPTVIKAVKYGAFDYLVKPIKPDQLTHSLERALEHKHMIDFLVMRHQEGVEKGLDTPDAFKNIITCDEKMLRFLHESELHARSEIPILITGETGVGKELLSQAIHKASPRANGPFVAVNMLSITPTLFESEFFGHAKGAFTGAVSDKAGYLAKAKKGTLFLDEIGDLSMDIQGKLLRILQEGEFIPVGKTQPEKANVRFVAATNQDLEKQVQKRKFRMDLYYRLRFAHVHIPPLRQRRDDIRLLADKFIRSSTRPDASLSEKAEATLVAHNWPGNIRELKGVIEASANLAESGKIKPKHLNLPAQTRTITGTAKKIEVGQLEPLAEVERRHIMSVYEAMGNNKTHTANVLGISLQTLHRKLKAYRVK